MIDLEAIKARLEAATPGPWIIPPSKRRGRHKVFVSGEFGTYNICDSLGEMDSVNAEFVAHAPTDIARLIEEVERLRRHIDRWVRGPLGNSYLSTQTKPPTKDELAKHQHDGIGFCKVCSVRLPWPCPVEVQRGWKE